MTIQEKIRHLKTQKKAIILAHIYQRPEIQDIADYLGDSLGLAQQAATTKAEIIVFCGVDFMAETAKILAPQKKVLVPNPQATCPLARMITSAQLQAVKEQYPAAAVVCYVNTNAEIKAASTICCTSRNAVQIVRALPEQQIIFVPDKSLGAYVAAQLPEKQFIFWPGYCPTHHRILATQLIAQKKLHPQAKITAHPECTTDVLALADFIGSTGGIQAYVAKTPAQEFIIATELGTIYRLQQDNPTKTFYHPTALGSCPNMKKNTLVNLARALETEAQEVQVDEKIACQAKKAIVNMLKI
jgi:quinolinate synthase